MNTCERVCFENCCCEFRIHLSLHSSSLLICVGSFSCVPLGSACLCLYSFPLQLQATIYPPPANYKSLAIHSAEIGTSNCMYLFIGTYVGICMYTDIYIYIYIYLCVCVGVCVCVLVGSIIYALLQYLLLCAYVCMYEHNACGLYMYLFPGQRVMN